MDNVGEKIVGLEKDIEYLKECTEKLEKIRNGNTVQDQSLANLELRLIGMEEFMESHKEWHDKLDSKKDDRNWQLWTILITLVVTTIGGIIAIKLV